MGANFLEWFAKEGKHIHGDTVPSPVKNVRSFVIKQLIGVVCNYPLKFSMRNGCEKMYARSCCWVYFCHKTCRTHSFLGLSRLNRSSLLAAFSTSFKAKRRF